MAAYLVKKCFSTQKCKLFVTSLRISKVNHLCTHSSLRYHSFLINTRFLRKTAIVSSCSPGLSLRRHLTIGEKFEESASLDKVGSTISNNIESTLTSQELGGWSPIGIVQQILTWLHESVGLPWWASIAVATLFARTLMFPLFVKAQKNAIIMNNNLPQVQVLQMKITEARQNGNSIEAAKYSNELIIFMQEKNCNPLKSMLVPLAQAPVFVSFFFGLRQMANLPVETFKNGGALWFTDLTLTDPYFLLPVITCVTLFITIELNADGTVKTGQTKMVQNLMRAVPLIVFPFVINFPAAILCYWVTSNGVTLMQVGLLKFSEIRKYLKMPERIVHSEHSFPGKPQKGFVESFREAWTNSKITREMQSRSQADELQFRKAGMGPLAKSLKSDSTKQKRA